MIRRIRRKMSLMGHSFPSRHVRDTPGDRVTSEYHVQIPDAYDSGAVAPFLLTGLHCHCVWRDMRPFGPQYGVVSSGEVLQMPGGRGDLWGAGDAYETYMGRWFIVIGSRKSPYLAEDQSAELWASGGISIFRVS